MSLSKRTVRSAAFSVLFLGGALANAAQPAATPAAAAPASAPAPATLATCDIYMLIERLLETDAFAKPIKASEDAIKATLQPIEEELNRLQTELTTMRDELQRANPQDPTAQARFADFETKRKAFDAKVQAYNTTKNEKAATYAAMVSGQFVQAYEQVNAAIGKVAKEKGYTHVIAQKSGKIAATDPRRLIEEFLARPMTIQPEGSDLTETVRLAMNLPEKSAAELKAAAEAAAPAATPASAPAPAPAAPNAGGK